MSIPVVCRFSRSLMVRFSFTFLLGLQYASALLYGSALPLKQRVARGRALLLAQLDGEQLAGIEAFIASPEIQSALSDEWEDKDVDGWVDGEEDEEDDGSAVQCHELVSFHFFVGARCARKEG